MARRGARGAEPRLVGDRGGGGASRHADHGVLQQALVPVVRAIGYGAKEVAAARATVSPGVFAQLKLVPSFIVGNFLLDTGSETLAALDAIDVGKMTVAAAYIASAVESAKLERFTGREFPAVEIDTPFGAIVVHGRANDTYMPGSKADGAALLVDVGGADTYRIAVGAGTFAHPVSVAIDVAGRDLYGYVEKPGGADGVGHRLPSDGNVRTQGMTTSRVPRQGAADLGIGLLFDLAGDDTYLTDPGDPTLGGDAIYPNAQLPGPPQSTLAGNTSMSQGCGRGQRPDAPLPGFQFAGGMGVLRDAAGNDKYTTSVFGQGCGFAMGIGLFLEGGGDDVYEGLWYVQGATAHTSVTLFHDAAGNDKYNPTFPIVSTSIGVGHDLSVAVHFDEAGDDTYRGPNLSLGSGNANGIGLLVNVGGVDAFTAATLNALGAANSTEILGTSRKLVPTLGVFVKAKGQGSYVVGGIDAGAYAGGSWSYAPNLAGDGGAPQSGEKSIGIDRPNANATLP